MHIRKLWIKLLEIINVVVLSYKALSLLGNHKNNRGLLLFHQLFKTNFIMKTILVITCALLSTLSLNAQQPPIGIWNTGKENTKIEIAEVNGFYEGEIVSSDNAKAKIRKLLLKEVKSVDGEWKGKLFAAKRGEWVDAILEEKDNQLVITVSKGWMKKTVKWSKD